MKSSCGESQKVENWFSRYGGSELRMLLFVVLTASAFIFVDLGALEFFRHTEADRSLIAWEMVESKEFLVPHLLGSPVLTKPPLFYWLQASSFVLFSEISEYTARFPSALLGVFFCVLHFCSMRHLGFSRAQALLLVLVVLSSSQFFILARSAEIDFAYGFFSWIALYALFFAEYYQNTRVRVFAYLLLALACLTKGPPIIVFYFAALLFLRVILQQGSVVDARWLRENVLGLFVFLGITGVWLLLLGESVGWAALVEEFRTELLARAWEPSERERGLLFYPIGFVATMLPWSAVALLSLSYLVVRGRRKIPNILDRFLASVSRLQREFFYYSCFLVVFAIGVLSLSQGKSNRYLFPVHVFGGFLFGFIIVRIAQHAHFKPSGKSISLFLLGLALCAEVLGLYFLHDILEEEVSRGVLLVLSGLVALVLVGTYIALRRGSVRMLAIPVLLVIVLLRMGYSSVYIPHRNAHRSVRTLVVELDRAVDAEDELYTLEMFERWVVFYLKQQGRQVKRVTPKIALQLAKRDEPVYLLLNESEESWRVAELRHFHSETSVIRRLEDPDEPLLLVQTSGKVLPKLALQQRFPTEPSPPKLTESFVMPPPTL